MAEQPSGQRHDYTLSAWLWRQQEDSVGAAFDLAFASDTVSITIMEIVDNLIMVASPAPWTPGSALRGSGSASPERRLSQAR